MGSRCKLDRSVQCTDCGRRGVTRERKALDYLAGIQEELFQCELLAHQPRPTRVGDAN